MAEAVGLAASVLSVAQIAWTVAKGLHDLADEVGSAGEAVRIFANDFSLFVENLKKLGELLEGLPPTSRQAETATEDLLEVALEQVVQPFQVLLRDLQPLLVRWHDSPSRMKQLGVRLQWAFSYKSKVLFFHGALNALKSNVSLLLQTMALKGQHQPHIYFILRGSIENTKAALPGIARRPTPRLLQSGQVVIEDPRMIMPKPASSTTSLAVAGPATRTRSSGNRDPDEAAAGIVVVTDVDDPDDSDFASASNAFAGISLLADEIPEDVEDCREERMEIWGTIRTVQRKIVRLADEAVATPAPSSNGIETSRVYSAVSDTSTSNRNAEALQPQPESSHESPQIVVAQASPEAIQFWDTLDNQFEIPYHMVRTWEAMKAFMVTEYTEVGADIDHIVSLPKDAKVKACSEAGYQLVFGNSMDDSRTFSTEQEAEEVWHGSAYVETPSALVETLGRLGRLLFNIRDERFTLFYRTGPSGQKHMMLPDTWETSVKPGWIIELYFDKEDLNELKNKFPPSHRRTRYAQKAALNSSSASGSLPVGAPPSGSGARSISPGPSLSPSAEGGRSHRRSLSGLIGRLGVSSN